MSANLGFWGPAAARATDEERLRVLRVVQDRLKTLADLPALSEYFFARPTPNWSMIDQNKQLKKLGRDEQIALLTEAKAALENLTGADFANEEKLQNCLNELLQTTDSKPMILFGLIRYALTWAPFSPGLPETMRLLGREETLARIDAAIEVA